MKKKIFVILTFVGLGCAPDEHAAYDDTPTSHAAKAAADQRPPRSPIRVEGCDALSKLLQDRAIAEMKQALATSRARFPAERCINRPTSNPGATTGIVTRPTTPVRPTTPTSPSPSTGSRPAGEGPASVSGTNNQVAGVDEADIVKTVDGVLYIVNREGLHVVQGWPADTTRALTRVKLTGTPRELFVEGGRAVVYSAIGEARRKRCTYGYDCNFTGDGSSTHVTVFDVREPAAPRVVRELDLSGSLLAARRLGNTIHTVVSDEDLARDFRYLTTPQDLYPCTGEGLDPQSVDAQFAKLEQDNIRKIRATNMSAAAPRLRDSAHPASEPGCGVYYAADIASGANFTSIFSFDLANDQPVARSSLVSRPGAVYVSEQAVYMAVRDVDAKGSASTPARETSAVHRFRIGDAPAHTRYEASGSVPGHALNQFAMDEWQGHLRIATTSGWVPDPNTHSTFSVLAQDGAKLKVVGEVGQIAPSEDIRSVRFVGPRGYVVTFKKTDPLFVLDLSRPRAPRVLGELKIPGFSTYMHPLDDDHLLTIGYDADDQGSFAYFSGVLLQIFDVSNPRAPRQKHKAVIGTRGSSSEALTNHLAFNYFADRKLLAVPMTICQGGQAGSFGTHMSFSGLMLFDIDLARGISERGRVAHPPLATGRYDDASCNNWWTDAKSQVKRSVFMDDFVYSIAEDVVRVQSLSALGRDLAAVPLVTLPDAQ